MSNVAKVLWKSFQATIADQTNAEDLTTEDIRSTEVIIQANPGNTGTISIGDADGQFYVVPTTGIPLSDVFSNGVERKTFLTDIKIKGTNNGDKINVLYGVVS